mmetsp:Transcript_34584/g.114568  ORF Transcript_34584/g.114568 Transcript_34584/m.114568 type:complete len:202 (-) Transcript_34584:220-825(-)
MRAARPLRARSAKARTQFLSACSDVLISAPSRCRSLQCAAESAAHSEPAQSTRVRRPAARGLPPPPNRTASVAPGGGGGPRGGEEPSAAGGGGTSIERTMCERDDVAFAPVACVARAALAAARSSSSCAPLQTCRSVAPFSSMPPSAAASGWQGEPERRSTQRRPSTSTAETRSGAAEPRAPWRARAARRGEAREKTCSMV